jgi:uncharacterized protein
MIARPLARQYRVHDVENDVLHLFHPGDIDTQFHTGNILGARVNVSPIPPAMSSPSAIAFAGSRLLAAGSLQEVAVAVHHHAASEPLQPALVLDATTSAAIDLDLRGTADQVAARYAPADVPASDPDAAPEPRGPGRPRLGVVAREITLLPRHWDWLANQPGGASVTLRRLVEQARAGSVERDRARAATDATYRFLMHLAGNEIGFEEATRALFAGERERFLERIAMWPADVRAHAERLSAPAFSAPVA